MGQVRNEGILEPDLSQQLRLANMAKTIES